MMRRNEFATTEQDAIRILENGEFGVLSTADKNGIPYGVPLNYVYYQNKIYFHCAPDVGRKVINLNENSAACFTVVGRVERVPEKFSTRYESVIAEGKAELADDKKTALGLLIGKYASEFAEEGAAYIERAAHKTAVYQIEIEKLNGKSRFGKR